MNWNAGTVAGEDDESILKKLRAAELPLAVPDTGNSVEGAFTFYFASTSCLETNSAIADVRDGSAEIWGPQKNPIKAQEEIAKKLGIPPVGGEGARHPGRRLVRPQAVLGRGAGGRRVLPEVRQAGAAHVAPRRRLPRGPVHPMSTARIRAAVTGDSVLSFEQRHTSVSTDFTHGLGEAITSAGAKAPLGNLTFAESIFELTQVNPTTSGCRPACSTRSTCASTPARCATSTRRTSRRRASS